MTNKTLYPIGTEYMSRGKHPRKCTVVDVYTTKNLAGETVKVRYVSVHKMLDQDVFDYDVVSATIARGIVEETTK